MWDRRETLFAATFVPLVLSTVLCLQRAAMKLTHRIVKSWACHPMMTHILPDSET